MIVGKNSILVEWEHGRYIELTIHDSSVKNFLHHFLLTGFTVCSANEVTLFDFGLSGAVLILTALNTLGFALVWCTLLGNHVAILSHVPVEERPASVTAFVHVVALHQILCRKLRSFFTIFQFQTWFDHLRERNSVARTARSLVSNWTSKVISVNTREVVRVWDIAIWNIVCISESSTPRLSFGQSLSEFWTIISK